MHIKKHGIVKERCAPVTFDSERIWNQATQNSNCKDSVGRHFPPLNSNSRAYAHFCAVFFSRLNISIRRRRRASVQNWENCIPHTAGWKTEQRSPQGRLESLPVTNNLNIQQPKTQITFEVLKQIGCYPLYNFVAFINCKLSKIVSIF